MNVEPVAWVAERKTMLSMVFFLLALEAYRQYARELRPGPLRWVVVLFATGVDVETASDHFAVSYCSVGLLATATYVSR